ncbi:Fungalysin metallopeptidase (M36) [Planctomyces sp. SH-PL14]|nr:Fungalysin metallopeptidase (M36) [Planctomyces sp. SH-PL14]
MPGNDRAVEHAKCVLTSGTRRVPSFAFGRCITKARRTEIATLRAFFAKWGERLQIDAKEVLRSSPKRITGPAGEHLLYRQRVCERPVSKAWLRIDLDLDGNVAAFSNRWIPEAHARSIAVPIRGDRLTQADAERVFGVRHRRWSICKQPRLSMLRQGRSALTTWKIPSVDTKGAPHNLYLDARGGAVVYTERLQFDLSGTGLVFTPNPMVMANNVDFDLAGGVPTSLYSEVVLRDLRPTGFLDGPWVTTAAAPRGSRIYRPSGDFRVRRSNAGFSEVMAYYHIDAAQRRVRDLGIATAAPFSVPVNPYGVGTESSYSAATKTITLAYDGNTPDGEDAEIILHEYGHAIHDYVVHGFGQDSQSRAMAEGFCDYFAATHFDSVKGPCFRPGIASWDAKGEARRGRPPFLRRLDNSEVLSATSNPIEFWSSCLWALRERFGPMKGDKLAIGFFYYVPTSCSFADSAAYILAANQLYFGGRDEREIKQVFRARGIG